MKVGKKQKVVYYVLGAAALATGIYFLSNKDDVRRILDSVKAKLKLKKDAKKDNNE
jgi:hypothetical protein